MADEPHVIRGINWKETFPFTLIFRSFRVAVHPSKLVLALLALLSIYCGGRILDAIWPARYLAVPNEVGIYAQQWLLNDDAGFISERDADRKSLDADFNAALERIGKKPDSAGISDIRYAIVQDRDKAAAAVRDAYEKSSNKSAESLRRARQPAARHLFRRRRRIATLRPAQRLRPVLLVL